MVDVMVVGSRARTVHKRDVDSEVECREGLSGEEAARYTHSRTLVYSE
jgi:hypothetical protein